jgi:hypothetical protein
MHRLIADREGLEVLRGCSLAGARDGPPDGHSAKPARHPQPGMDGIARGRGISRHGRSDCVTDLGNEGIHEKIAPPRTSQSDGLEKRLGLEGKRLGGGGRGNHLPDLAALGTDLGVLMQRDFAPFMVVVEATIGLIFDHDCPTR